MIYRKLKQSLFSLSLCAFISSIAVSAHAGFDVIALGVQGGVSSDNLTSYLIKADDSEHYLALDAGTTVTGITKAIEKNSFPELAGINLQNLTPSGYVLQNLIDSYWISHGHLDHFSGLVIASPDDVKKNVYGMPATLNYLTDNIFNWIAWPNMTDKGSAPQIGTFILKQEAMDTPFSIGDTRLTGIMYPLNHGGYPSSMLLVINDNESFAFFGDTGPDVVQKSNELDAIWQILAPKIKDKSLKGMIIETSYDNSVPDSSLYGHLTPKWLLHELQALEQYSGGKGSLNGFPVVIGHIKPSLKQDAQPEKIIKQQLESGNNMGIKFIFPVQGERYEFE